MTLQTQVMTFVSTLQQLGPLPPHAIAWADHGDHITVCLEDGRKLSFPNTEREPAVTITIEDGIDDQEAAAAGKALRARRSRK